MAKVSMGNRPPTVKKTRLQQAEEAGIPLSYGDNKISLDDILTKLPFEQMRKDIEDLKNKPKAMGSQSPQERIIEHHVKTVNVTHEITKTKDKLARLHTRLLKKKVNNLTLDLHRDVAYLDARIDLIESRKPEEKQIVTHTETIREIEYKLDKRVLIALGISIILNIVILIIK